MKKKTYRSYTVKCQSCKETRYVGGFEPPTGYTCIRCRTTSVTCTRCGEIRYPYRTESRVGYVCQRCRDTGESVRKGKEKPPKRAARPRRTG